MNYKTPIVTVSLAAVFISAGINLNNPDNYANQNKPNYINKDNSAGNLITDKGATLGRVLFYDKKLSVNNQVSCASCHKQQFAFGDTARQSLGVSGVRTTRHGMRLVNARFGNELKFFWDERVATLEVQTSQPIQNHDEMGYSGQNGDPGIATLIAKLSQESYYTTLFSHVYGDPAITETRIQKALAQFIRSIQSFDSKFDAGLTQVGNLNAPFPNYTATENQGKTLFLSPANQGGAGCQGCHRAPEFDIDPNTKNNGVIGVAGSPGTIDIGNTRAPSLRDIFNPGGTPNGPMMHNGNFITFTQVLNHYNQVPLNVANTNLDPRLAGPGGNLQLTQVEQNALIAFIKTLSGSAVYSDPKWSNPFDVNGNLALTTITGLKTQNAVSFGLYPNPAKDLLRVDLRPGNYQVRIMDTQGHLLFSKPFEDAGYLDISTLKQGLLMVEITDSNTGFTSVKKVIKE